MRKTQVVIRIILLIVSVGFISCEDELDVKIEVQTTDFSVSIYENPSENQDLGTVQGHTNIGKVTFEIVSQSPEGAFKIDPNTGLISVTKLPFTILRLLQLLQERLKWLMV